ncbi:uncharacterized protein LOC126904087 isoform X6 [Daktulosphaira vitifoliae]|uniref:uncharacterized protein LOC126904087 isoform X6 n=1 Tax=Daktulosphaira vitifoliae TaxID=58002 RepID=UPI0021A9C843|nr:uncharacterized protein LOC126904087 isoform X6 [Daktulosphaira vitifoliae]
MIKLVVYITGVLLSLIAQSLANGRFCSARKRSIWDNIDPIYNLYDTIKDDAADISNDNAVNNLEVQLDDCEFDKRTIYRFRALTEIEFGRLKDSIENGMTDEEFMARFWFLRRCQEPDRLLLCSIQDHIITKEDRKNIAELKAHLLSSKSSITSELEMYQKTFKQELTYDEKRALDRFFHRLNFYHIKFEFEIRKIYLNCL